MSTNEFCNLQHCRNYGCSKLNRDKDLCTKVKPPAKPSQVRRGIDCDVQTPRWSVKDCRAKECEFLGKEEHMNGDRCRVFEKFGTMPGTLTHCLQDPEIPADELLGHIPLPPIPGGKEGDEDSAYCYHPWKTPGIKNCPDPCPYKLIEEVDGSGKRKIKKGECAFCGGILGANVGICRTTILDAAPEDQQHQIAVITIAIKRMQKYPASAEQCSRTCCPDGIQRCTEGDTACPLIKIPFAELKECPLWRIPAKLLPVPACTPAEEPVCPPSGATKPKKVAQIPEKSEEPADPQPESGRKEKKPSRKTAQKENPEEPKKRQKKEKDDPICEACRERYGKPIPDHACEACRAELKEKGRRAWITDLPLGAVHLGDMEILGGQIPDESVDAIFTDPEYIAESWENAYARLGEMASRVLKPYGFLFTYAPQAHLDEIMDLLRYSVTNKSSKRALQYFWIIQSLNKGPHQKAYKWNAICKHKPILVFQKAAGFDDLHGSRRCFSDVVNGYRQKAYHQWQQSVHDVLGIISRFMAPGEILLDPYAGTGTSLIAANLLGMEWIGFEIEPKTHAIAVRELQQQPIGLFTFGGEEPDQTAPREIKEEKDTSKQAAIYDTTGKTVKQIWHDVCDKCEDGCKGQDDPKCLIKRTRGPSRPDPENPISQVCIECDVYKDCLRRDPYAGCLDAVKAIIKAQEERDEGEQGRHPAGPGGPTPGTCGTCGHHKGKKTFHPSCPRLGELLFMKGTKSAKVLMEETQRERCGHWLDKNDRCKEINDLGNCTISERCDRKTFEERAAVGCSVPIKPVKPKRDTPEWFEALTEAKRRNNPGWIWEVWKHDPAKGEWLYEGADTYQGAVSIKNQIEETRPDGSKVHFSLRPRPKPDYPTDDIEGPCKVCKIECIDEDGNDGCWEFEEHVRRLEEDGEPASPRWGYREICIISCGKAKIWDEPAKGRKKTPARVVAREAYTGPLFTLARKYAEHVFEGDEYYILSDKYGLIRPGDEIENYDVSPEDIENDPEFFDMVQQRAKADPDLAVVKKITLLCGQIHQRIIEGAFHGVEIINPVQDLPQGKRMHALKQLVEHKEPSKEYGAEKNCDNCLGCGGGIILRDCPSFDDVVSGKLKAEDLISSVKKDGCSGWKPGVKIAEKKPPSKKKRSPKKPKECETP